MRGLYGGRWLRLSLGNTDIGDPDMLNDCQLGLQSVRLGGSDSTIW